MTLTLSSDAAFHLLISFFQSVSWMATAEVVVETSGIRISSSPYWLLKVKFKLRITLESAA